MLELATKGAASHDHTRKCQHDEAEPDVVQHPRRIGTGSNAEPATYAAFIINQHRAIRPFESCIHWANGNTGWVVTMLAGLWHMERRGMRILLHL